jgi:mannosyltransferase
MSAWWPPNLRALVGSSTFHRAIGVYVTMLSVVSIGTWLRFRNLSADSIWLDESVSWLQSKGSLADLISATAQDVYPPLHNLLLFAFMNVSGTDTEWVLRAPSALLGIANIVAIYWLGALIGGRIAGVLAAAVLATSGFHIYYSQEARMYALLALSTTLYAAAAFFFAKSPTCARAALLAVCGLALVYSHAFGTLNWIAIAIGMSTYIVLTSDFPRRALFPWVIANAAIAIGFLPWALILLQRARGIGDFWAPYPSPAVIYTELYLLVGGRLVAVALLIGAAVALRSNFHASIVLLFWAVAPVGLTLIESLVRTPIFVARYFIGSLPALVTLAALGLAHLLSRQRWPTVVTGTVILAALIIGNLRYVTAPRDDWRTAATYLQGRLHNSDCVLVYPAFAIIPLRYYLRTEFCTILPTSIAEIDGQAISAGRIFAVLSKVSETNRFRVAMSRYGPEAEHFNALRIAIIEYQRPSRSAVSTHDVAAPVRRDEDVAQPALSNPR